MADDLPTFQIAIPFGEVKDAQGKVIGQVYMSTQFHRALLAFRAAIAAKLTPAALAAAVDTFNDAIIVITDATTAAQAAADNANAATASNQLLLDLINSTTSGCAVTAADVGANVTITISAHTRIYGDNTSVAVSGGTITAQPYATSLFIFYDQASRAGGAVTYQASATAAGAKPSTALPDRHYVGAILTPAALAAATDGSQAVYGQYDVPDANFQYL